MSHQHIPGGQDPTLHKEKHVRYWLRCLKTFLPTEYTSNDSNRVLLGFFIVSALDLLSVLTTRTTVEERDSYIAWIYRCQHPSGGFRGFPATDFGPERSSPENAHWDPANLPATYLGLATLVLLGDDLEKVKRRECLRWLRRLHRKDGSFGETLGEDGEVEGGSDTRFCHLAAGTRWLLRGRDNGGGEEDIDVDKLVIFLKSLETYDHGFANVPYHEAHGGFTYCAIGALSFLDALPAETTHEQRAPSELPFLERTIPWLVSRQAAPTDEDDESEDEEERDHTHPVGQEQPLNTQTQQTLSSSHHISDNPGEGVSAGLPVSIEDIRNAPQPLDQITGPPLEEPDLCLVAGFNGRCNKPIDTCYSFWIGASLAILKREHLISGDRNRRFLLDHTQHIVGGFGKMPGDPPDILHSFLGLAALSLLPTSHPPAETTRAPDVLDDLGLKALDPTTTISCSARRRIEEDIWPRWS